MAKGLILQQYVGSLASMKVSFASHASWVVAATTFCAMLGMGCSSSPSSAVGVLESAEQFQIYRLEPFARKSPKPGQAVFHNRVILGQVDIKDAPTKSKIANIVNRGIRQGGVGAICFNPRHGIHAVHAGKTVDLVICYECSIVEVGENGQWTTMTTADVQADLDDAFKAAGMPLEK